VQAIFQVSWYFANGNLMNPLFRREDLRSRMIRKPAFPAIIFALLGCLLFSANAGFAQDAVRNLLQGPAQARLTLPEVVERLTEMNAVRAAELTGYRSRRSYQVDYKGIPGRMHAEMVVELTYSAPSTEDFTVVSQSGSKLLIDFVLKRLLESERESHEEKNRDGVQITSQNYNFTMLDSQNAPDGCSYVLGVEPKVPSKFLFRGRIWVNDKDFAVCRIEAQPAKNPSFWIKKTEIHHSFMKVGDFWLPAQNTSVSRIRMDGRATLTIKYGNYEVETTRALNLHVPRP
jgi:hypothetical protein